MIPKKIHYCWFGRGEKPKLAQKCIASWNKYCPDYEIIEWNEDNFDINYNAYTKFCYENKKWAFLSDYVRLVVVAEHGGIYFDTDVEVVKNFDDLLVFEAFYGFENNKNVNTGEGFASEKGHPTLVAMKEVYDNLPMEEDGTYELKPCPALNTMALIPFGLQLGGQKQNICGAEILPVDFLNPYDDPTGILRKTKNTYSIHWYGKSWMSKKIVIKIFFTKPLHRLQKLFKKN